MKTKKAIIFDLDNTIYPVDSISDALFKDLFELITNSEEQLENMEKIKYAIERKPFQIVAKEFRLSDSLTSQGIKMLSNIEYNGTMMPFPNYTKTRELNIMKFLVTTGFTKLQWSKIRHLDIENDFEKIIIIDPTQSRLTKKDIFKNILEEYSLQSDDVLVIGDDIHSEIKAAQELGIDTLLYDYTAQSDLSHTYATITDYAELADHLREK